MLVAVTVKLAVLPRQSSWLAGWLPLAIVGAALTITVALAVASVLGTLSTTGSTLLLPAASLPVKVTVAVPVDWMLVCAPESVPFTTEKLMGSPISCVKLPVETAVFKELVKKLAVATLVLAPSQRALLLTLVVKSSLGVVINVPVPEEPAGI